MFTMVEKFLQMSKYMKKKMGTLRVLTDVSAERYWTAVAEFEVKSMADFKAMMAPDSMEEMGPIMEGYKLIDHGRREIYNIEG